MTNDEAALTKDRLEASVLIETLKAADDIVWDPICKSVTFKFRYLGDSYSVFETITGKLP